MAKYSKGASKKVAKVMREKKRGTLRSGSGRKVTSRKQAIAIGLSEARKAGSKVPKKAAKKRAGRPAKKRGRATARKSGRKMAKRSR
jgi:hypothetical protein